ncbi:glycosyltransferase family A protein [Pseudomonadota bacterium]
MKHKNERLIKMRVQTSKKPVVSTIIPAFNGEKYLEQALESALSQTWTAQEIILVDDGSTDSTARIAHKFAKKLTYVRQSNQGTASARNAGVDVASGEYFAFLDQDDLWMPEKLTIQISAFLDNPTLDVVFGHLQQFISPELEPKLGTRIRCAPDPVRGILTSTMVASRNGFAKAGYFDSQWQLGEWSDWYVHAVEAGLKIHVLPDVLARRRLHDGNKGLVQREHLNEYPRLLKASLDRRRGRRV